VTDLATAARQLDIAGSTALVAGGSKGIGLGTARHLLERGAHVVVTGRGEESLEEALGILRPVADRAGTSVHGVAGDVSVEADVERAVEVATGVQGKPPQAVVASAGNGWITRFLSMSTTEWDEVHRTHVRGSFLVLREAARALVTAGLPGSMVVITSLNADAATGGTAAYSAAKAAQTQLVRVTARELGRHQIRVNSVAPGITVTPMTDSYLEGAYRQAFIDGTPLTRLGEVDDIADVICFLLSRQGRWVNGAAVPVDGGAHLHGLHDYADVLERPAWPED
jgi:NAD(P)-dependent dehydrogenase (short-subunit alcohol dehydrogenase family)